MKVPFVDLAAQYRELASEIDEAISGVIRTSDFILGKELTRFEEEFAEFCGVGYAVGVDSGISALELSLRALGIGPGDEVITAVNSFIATASPISVVGARPVFVDLDPQTYNIDVDAVERAITSRTRAIIPVHLYGQPVDMDPLLEMSHAHGLYVIEDACQAHGARYKGRRAGSLGHAGAFSFYPGKNLGAFGDGGMAVTNDPTVAERIRMLRNYGQKVKYHHEAIAYNRRLDTIQAAVLRAKLRRLDDWNASRRQRASQYTRLLRDVDVSTPKESDIAEHIYHLYVIRTENRDALQRYLSERGIATGIHYPIPIHLQPAYRDFGYQVGHFPIAEQYAGELLSLPMYPHLTEEQVGFVVEVVREFFGGSVDLRHSGSVPVVSKP